MDICPLIITDRQYLSDNLLCLVSNAVKFSDRGATIDVHLRLENNSKLFCSRQVSFMDHLELSALSGGLKFFSPRIASIDMQLELLASTGRSADSPNVPTEMVLVTVEDTGIGLSDEAKVNVFNTTQQVRNSGGTGLGLYSLAKRIEALGGKYGVKNRSDGKQGSLFWFTFPYRPDTSASMEFKLELPTLELPTEYRYSTTGLPMEALMETPTTATAPPSPVTGLFGSSTGSPTRKSFEGRSKSRSSLQPTLVIPPLRILLVDDSSAILKITGRFLKANGHTVETADNGLQCLERLKMGRRDFDVLITDLQMPVMDGFTSVREYRAWEIDCLLASSEKEDEGEGLGRLYIIGMSANSDEESVKDALAAGMDDFVMKPFNYDVLAASLKGVLLVR